MKKVLLIILDGWGIGKIPASDAIKKANTPAYESLLKKYSNAQLVTFGKLQTLII